MDGQRSVAPSLNFLLLFLSREKVKRKDIPQNAQIKNADRRKTATNRNRHSFFLSELPANEIKLATHSSQLTAKGFAKINSPTTLRMPRFHFEVILFYTFSFRNLFPRRFFFLPAETLNQKPHNHLLPQPCIFTEIINTHKSILRVVVLPADLAQQFVGTLLSPAGDLHHVRHIENGSGWHSGMQFS